MKINNLTIDGVGGIRNLELSFNDGFNVICGANGIGKTTILNTVADAFSNSGELLKRNSMVAEGKYCIGYFDITGKEVVEEYKVKEFDPLTQDSGRYASDNSSFIMFFGINRIINYEVLNAIPKDSAFMATLIFNDENFKTCMEILKRQDIWDDELEESFQKMNNNVFKIRRE